LRQHGDRALIVVDPFLKSSPLVEELVAACHNAGITTELFSDISPDVPVAALEAGAKVARTFQPDAILAVGGGSAMDAAKVIALLATYDEPVATFYGENAVPGAVLPLVALPTTAGTGSEVTPVAVVLDPDRDLKIGISSPFLIPTAAVVDPEMTIGAPASTTAYAGIDALVHVVESYTAREFDLDWTGMLPVFTGRNVLSELLATAAAERLVMWLPRAVADGSDRDARENVALGSLLAGISFGSTGTHLSHALQYPIGALTHTPHGLGTGLLLPFVLDVLREDAHVERRIASLANALDVAAPSAPEAVDGMLRRLLTLNAQVGVPRSLAELKISREELPRIAELGARSTRLVAIAPVRADSSLLLEVLNRAYEGRVNISD
jgi:alcohol dehydrogenase